MDNDKITARDLNQLPEVIAPSFSLILVSCVPPTITSNDGAFWRRIIKINYNYMTKAKLGRRIKTFRTVHNANNRIEIRI